MQDKSSPWRQPVVWLVAALPLGSVVAAGLLIYFALSSSGSDDVVRDPVRRTAQIQQVDLGPDARARALQLGAVLRVDRAYVEVLPAGGDFDRMGELVLSLEHPSHADADRTVRLTPSENGWRAPVELDLGHDWKLQLADTQGVWRIGGRLPKQQRAAHLAATVAAP